jgi:hypothetical protein
MKLTSDLRSSFCTSVAGGIWVRTKRVVSRMVVVTIKKNRSMKMMSGKEAVLIATVLDLVSFLNLAIIFSLLCL